MVGSFSTLRVLIVGCGNIAGGFDERRPADALPLSHAGAYRRDGRFDIVGCIEPDAGRRAAFQAHWGIPHGYADFSAVPPSVTADIIAICAPTAFRSAHLEAAIARSPRLIFCEKPIAPTLHEARLWVERCAEAGIPLAINHTRRWAPDVARLRDELRQQYWGEIRSVTGTYNKGILNNGSHLVDAIRLLLDCTLEIEAVGAPQWDFWPDDPTVPALLRTDSGIPVHLTTAHAGDYALFELQLVTSAGVLVMEDGGLRWRIRRAGDSAHFAGYKALLAAEQVDGRYMEAMLHAAANLHDAVHHGAPLACTGASALVTQALCDDIRERSQRRGAV